MRRVWQNRFQTFYEASGELAQWTDQDPKDIQDYQTYVLVGV